MATENPFPLNIPEKEDSWEKLQLLAHIDPRFKYTAEEWSLILQALQYLYENLGGQGSFVWGNILGDIQNQTDLIALISNSSGISDTKRTVYGFATTSSNIIDMIDGINARSAYTVVPGELVSYQTSIIDQNDVLNSSIITINTKNIGAGTYGAGATPLNGNQLWIAGTRKLAYGDAETDPSTQIINLGAHTSTTVTAVFNAHTFTGSEDPIQAKTTGLRLVNITLDGVDKQYFFTGAAGTYGTGGELTAVEAEFDEITGDVPTTDFDLAEAIHNASNKPTPVDADELSLADSEDSFSLKNINFANLKAFFKSYFDPFYNKDTISFVLTAPEEDIATGDCVPYMIAPYNFTLNNYTTSLDVAPTGSGQITRLKKNGTYADSVGATINSGDENSIGNNPTITSATFVKGDKIKAEITQIGSTTPGQYLIIYLEITKS